MQSSYLSQVRQLRKLGLSVLKRYPIDLIQLKFICHGENTTYKIISKKGNFLLRIHRKDYHSKNALLEELGWLKQLSKSSDLFQKPLASINGLLVEEISIDNNLETRLCSILTWVDGKMKYKSVSQTSMLMAGQLAGYLHKNTFKQKVKHRNYWNSEGLLGPNTKMGNLQSLKAFASKADYELIDKCRKMTLKKLENYSRKNPQKSSMIHADLHFGNMIWEKNNPIPIDFDDCGFGPQMYDLAVTISATDTIFQLYPEKARQPFIESLLNGYSSTCNLSKDDLAILPYLKLTRALVMLGWAYDRKDNPYILNHLKKTFKTKIKYFNKALKSGPDPLY